MKHQELTVLKTAIDELLRSVPDDAPEPALWPVVTKAVGVPAPWQTFKTSKEPYGNWQKYAPAVDVFLDSNFPTASRVQRHALMTFIVSSIIADLKGRNVLISIGSVVRNLGRFVQMFEDQFPGYIESGLQHMILKALSGR